MFKIKNTIKVEPSLSAIEQAMIDLANHKDDEGKYMMVDFDLGTIHVNPLDEGTVSSVSDVVYEVAGKNPIKKIGNRHLWMQKTDESVPIGSWKVIFSLEGIPIAEVMSA